MSNPGNTAWLLVATTLVLLMTPGLAFFYGGMVSAKNVLATAMQSFTCMAVVAVLWVLDLFSLAFGADRWHGLIGDAGSYLGLRNGGAPWANGVPTVVFAGFQITFAVVTAALISGAAADRMRFGGFLAFVAVWSVAVYAPVAHWVWGGGWLARLGVEDFAGGTVVHISAGAAGLALTLVLGRRLGWPGPPARPHNVPFVLLGTGLLWFGWLGFNAGSELAADATAGFALVNSLVAPGAAMLGWLAVERVRNGHPSAVGGASGLVAGLVAITPACGFVTPAGAVLVGGTAGVCCALARTIKFRFRFDDALDVVAVHLVGGVVGALSVGLLGRRVVNPLGRDGLLAGGGPALLIHQAVAVAAVIAFVFLMTLVIAKGLDIAVGLRVSADVELAGLDAHLHGESAYHHEIAGHDIAAHQAAVVPR